MTLDTLADVMRSGRQGEAAVDSQAMEATQAVIPLAKKSNREHELDIPPCKAKSMRASLCACFVRHFARISVKTCSFFRRIAANVRKVSYLCTIILIETLMSTQMKDRSSESRQAKEQREQSEACFDSAEF